MKYIIPFLLLFIISCSNTRMPLYKKPIDLTSVEIYKNYGGISSSNCELRYIPLHGGMIDSDYIIRYFSKDNQTVQNLYNLFLDGKNWKKNERDKKHAHYGDEKIQNMIVINYNSFQDTIYTTKDNKSFYYKDGNYEYLDEDNTIVNAFANPIKNFFLKDFLPDIKKLEKLKNDSIDVNTLKLDGKRIYGLTKIEFEEEIDSMDQIVITKERFRNQEWDIHNAYYFRHHPIGFDEKDSKVNYISISGGETKITLNDNSIDIEDSYEKISSYFKNSAAKIDFERKLYNRKENREEGNIKRMVINFIDYKGYLLLTFKNEQLEEIEIIYGTREYN